MKQIFSRGPSIAAVFLLFFLLAIVLLILDAKTQYLKPLRQHFISLSAPFYAFVSFPGRAGEWASESLVTRDELQAENIALRSENYVLQQKLQKMAALIAENSRLTELLNSSSHIEDDVLVARLIAVSPDPLRQEMILDKGSDDGVYTGQAVLDASGLAGQVIEVAPSNSRVMLIVDSESAVPVQLARNGIRMVAEGTGVIHEMNLRFVAATTDILVDDILVSSGLDRRYPPNYPVARVVSIDRDPGQPFLVIHVEPLAQLNRSRHFLLVIDKDKTPHG